MIPKTFNILGKKYKVKFINGLVEERNWDGLHDFLVGEIHIQKRTKGYPVNKEEQERIFCHELVHAILRSLDERELNSNEQFVDRFGSVLHQVLKTFKGDLKDE